MKIIKPKVKLNTDKFMKIVYMVSPPPIPQEDGGKNCGDVGPVKLGFEWGGLVHMGAYRKAIMRGNSITFSEEIGNYVQKINE